ncbi:L,D-transpeptidase family protein [Paracoccus ravus]|uniref:L,D-transpeptidase family protein n=1 Tax=Paracoccus ravus TaxID=2447760 RepID=UPI00106EFCE9|nr:L,D-transpeptidase [Paracoccus ravus]
MSSRVPHAGALLRLSLISAAILAVSTPARAQTAVRPPVRAVEVTANMPVQAAVSAELQGQSGTGAAKALKSVSAQDLEDAAYRGGDLPDGQSALTAKVQVLLDRSGISPGVVDGWRGGMSESAIKAFQRRAGLPMTGRMNSDVWSRLQAYAGEPITNSYTITQADAEGLVDRIPTDYAEKAAMTSQGYTSVLENLAERFHMDEKFLAKLNPGAAFRPGETISVTRPAKPIRATVTRIIVDKETRRVAAYDANGRMVADYPATVGSSDTPSPHGTHKVNAIALNPTYTYNPQRNFKQGENDRVLIVPPGPNGPVGNVWIDLSEPTYGIHGTATPSRLFVNQSHGCVRLTNWDAFELAHMVKANVTTVEFLAPGVGIADVTQAVAPGPQASGLVLSSARPPMRASTAGLIGQPAETVQAEIQPSDATPRVRAKAIAAAVQEAASTVAVSIITGTRPRAAPPERGEPLSEALARAEALADDMLAQRAADMAATTALNDVTGQKLPPPAKPVSVE